jgi:hypothetical protein
MGDEKDSTTHENEGKDCKGVQNDEDVKTVSYAYKGAAAGHTESSPLGSGSEANGEKGMVRMWDPDLGGGYGGHAGQPL